VYVDAGGDLVMKGPSGYTTVSPAGQVSSSPAASSAPTPAPSGGTVTPNQAAAYASILSNLATAGARIAVMTNLPPGATILPNGTILGAGQSYGTINQSVLTKYMPAFIAIFAAALALELSK